LTLKYSLYHIENECDCVILIYEAFTQQNSTNCSCRGTFTQSAAYKCCRIESCLCADNICCEWKRRTTKQVFRPGFGSWSIRFLN